MTSPAFLGVGILLVADSTFVDSRHLELPFFRLTPLFYSTSINSKEVAVYDVLLRVIDVGLIRASVYAKSGYEQTNIDQTNPQ
jgi:hypothetical protein